MKMDKIDEKDEVIHDTLSVTTPLLVEAQRSDDMIPETI